MYIGCPLQKCQVNKGKTLEKESLFVKIDYEVCHEKII